MKDIQTFQDILQQLLLVHFVAMWKWPWIRDVLEILDKFLQTSCKVTGGFLQVFGRHSCNCFSCCCFILFYFFLSYPLIFICLLFFLFILVSFIAFQFYYQRSFITCTCSCLVINFSQFRAFFWCLLMSFLMILTFE